MNNGNVFPQDFNLDDYVSFSKKSWNSKGQGLGGYLIGRVVENHNGTIKIRSEERINEVFESGKNISLKSNVDIVITIPKRQ